jgi:hypothetical protein
MHKRSSLFWGLVLIILATLLLLHQLGVLPGDMWGYFWPIFLILMGIWLIAGFLFRKGKKIEVQSVSIPLQNAKSASIKLEHGAGKLSIQAGAASSDVLTGKFGSEIKNWSKLNGDDLQIDLRPYPQFWSWYPGERLDWDISLNKEIPIKLKIDSGASSSRLDLSQLKVVDLDIDTGASNLDMTLPAAAGNTHVDIDAGASSITIHIPDKVACRIVLKTGMSSISINTKRFPMVEKSIYLSQDYATSENKADITIDSGVGSVRIE